MTNSTRVRHAFTLIELLVVIAIIAILAAILFPVFAQAKEAAKKTTSLSNVKQIGLSLQMYVADADDTTPSLGAGDYSDWLYPYTKNVDIFKDPERNDKVGGCTEAALNGYQSTNGVTPASNTDIPHCYYAGYGYNWGPIQRRGGGLLADQQLTPDGQHHYIPGRSMTSIQAPADMFAFGTSYDTPRITMDITFLLCTFTGNKQSQLRYGGQWPTGFADGHAKAIKWTGGYMQGNPENGEFAVPANLNLIADYCFDPGYVLNQGNDGNTDSIPVPNGTTCAQLPDWFKQNVGTAFTYFPN